jgi:hypothetical protein
LSVYLSHTSLSLCLSVWRFISLSMPFSVCLSVSLSDRDNTQHLFPLSKFIVGINLEFNMHLFPHVEWLDIWKHSIFFEFDSCYKKCPLHLCENLVAPKNVSFG